MKVIFQFSEIFSPLWEIKVEPFWSARQTEINRGWLWSRGWCDGACLLYVQCKWRNSHSTICWCSQLGQFMLGDINVGLVSPAQHCPPSDHRAPAWSLIGGKFPGDVIWCQWFRSGDSQPEYWRRQSMFYVCQVDIINHTRLRTTCSVVFRGAVCVPTLITVAKWSTASEILYPGIPSSTQRKTTPSQSRPTKISSLLRSVSGCWASWHCKYNKYVLTFT